MKEFNVLIVDDSDLSRMNANKCLKKIGFEKIKFADNGKKAYEMASEEYFDFIFLDWNMPVMTGLEFIKKFNKELNTENEDNKTKVIMITAEASLPQVLEAMSHGLTDYIVKPLQFDALEKKLIAIINNNEKIVITNITKDKKVL